MNDTDLKFRTLPFQRIINVLVSPMCIVYSKSMTSIKNRSKYLIINKVNDKYFEIH